MYFMIMTIIFMLPIVYSLVNKDAEKTVSRLIINEKYYLVSFAAFLILGCLTLQYEKLRKNQFSYYFMYFFTACCLLFCFFHPKEPCHILYAILAFFSVVCWLFTNSKNDAFLTTMLFLQLICSVYLYIGFNVSKMPNLLIGEVVFLLIMFFSYSYIHIKNK